jgi:N-acetylmuramoyl-L-alanine amidase
METALLQNVLTEGRYVSGAEKDMIIWKASVFPATNIDFDGEKLTVRFGVIKYVPSQNINLTGTLFQTMQFGFSNGAPSYTLTLRDGANLEGFYVDYANGELRLHLKKRKSLTTGDKPLTGFTFVIDAGHGGTESGALGPMGSAMPEKTLNLNVTRKLALRLTQLGASVTTVRTADDTHTLYSRTELSRKTNPDMFISIHGNSMNETTDASNIKGLTVWYRNPASKPLADSLMAGLHRVNPGTTRRVASNQSNFYVCRPSWAPSVLIETSFMCNIQDFAWMINDTRQTELANAIADAVVGYYRR